MVRPPSSRASTADSSRTRPAASSAAWRAARAAARSATPRSAQARSRSSWAASTRCRASAPSSPGRTRTSTTPATPMVTGPATGTVRVSPGATASPSAVTPDGGVEPHDLDGARARRELGLRAHHPPVELLERRHRRGVHPAPGGRALHVAARGLGGLGTAQPLGEIGELGAVACGGQCVVRGAGGGVGVAWRRLARSPRPPGARRGRRGGWRRAPRASRWRRRRARRPGAASSARGDQAGALGLPVGGPPGPLPRRPRRARPPRSTSSRRASKAVQRSSSSCARSVWPRRSTAREEASRSRSARRAMSRSTSATDASAASASRARRGEPLVRLAPRADRAVVAALVAPDLGEGPLDEVLRRRVGTGDHGPARARRPRRGAVERPGQRVLAAEVGLPERGVLLHAQRPPQAAVHRLVEDREHPLVRLAPGQLLGASARGRSAR